MAITAIPEQYFTYDGRIDSFQSAQLLSKRRASSASSKGPKSLKWPHSFLSAEEMAKAGFFHYPTIESPDNTICFLCRKSIVGWEDGDEPHKEHLKHSPDCGWAIVASINASDEDLCEEYPLSTRMIQARMATFGDRWPHENKKGWKCKIKQLVDAGWKYTPTLESDDMATCTYCELALDGWEPSDKPLDEHHKRSPDCTFFSLITEYKQRTTPKKATKGRRPRASKASRLSTQSTFTTTSEAPSFADTAADEGDSILTTATSATISSKAGKGKKTAGKGRKPKTKEEPLDDVPVPEPEDDDFSVKIDQPKMTRGRKRASEAMDEATLVVTQPPPAKRRATRSRGSIAIEEPLFAPSIETDVTMTTRDDLAPPKKGRKTRGSNAKSVRNFSSASTASQASLRMHALDDEEIDKMLQADLERPLTDDEGNDATAGFLPAKASTAAVRKTTRGSKLTKSSRDMFGLDNKEVDEAAIQAELEIMEVEESKPLPKAKGTKGKQARKPSAKQQAAAQKAAEAEAEAEKKAELEIAAQQPPKVLPTQNTRTSHLSPSEISGVENNDSGNENDVSMASQSTVVKGGASRRGSSLKKGRGGKKTASKNIADIVQKSIETFAEDAPKKQAARSKKVVHQEDVKILEEIHYPVISSFENPSAPAPSLATTKSKGKEKALPEPQVEIELQPAKAFTPQRSTKELTPTPSPQSSDAENYPPSSKPSTIKAHSLQTSRIQLVASTPTHVTSPSKRNILAGLQSCTPWNPVDLDEIFMSTPGFGNENFDVLREVAEKVKDGKLTSPEKKMSVEEWIVFNASLAEEKLRRACETMVGVFEKEGGRAMGTLEGIECDE